MTDRTLRELQTALPWTAHYHRDFRASPQTHKDFAHALLHIHKAGGKLATIIDEAEHGGFDWADPSKRAEVEKFVADMVICALRMATTCPDGQIDLQRAVENRLVAKNNQLAAVAPVARADETPNVFWTAPIIWTDERVAFERQLVERMPLGAEREARMCGVRALEDLRPERRPDNRRGYLSERYFLSDK